jgi:hypothetical protein
MKRIILTCLLILTGFVTLSWIEVWYWRYWPLEPIKVCPEITVLNPGKMVTAGQLMIYEVAFDKRMDVSCKVKRQLVNSYRIDYDPIEPPRKELGPQKAISSIHVPEKTDPGIWFMRWTADCLVGPEGRVISTTRESEKFQVIR